MSDLTKANSGKSNAFHPQILATLGMLEISGTTAASLTLSQAPFSAESDYDASDDLDDGVNSKGSLTMASP